MAKSGKYWVIQMSGDHDGTANTRIDRRSVLVTADRLETTRQEMRDEIRAVPAYSSDWVKVEEA